MLFIYIAMMSTIGPRIYVTLTWSLPLRFEHLGVLHDMTLAKTNLERSMEERTADLARSADAVSTNKRKDEFLAMLSHELHSPLASIQNALPIVRRLGVPDYTIKWAQEIIDRQVDRLTRKVDALLDVSRIDHGKISVRETVFDVASVIHRAVEGSLRFIEGRRQNICG